MEFNRQISNVEPSKSVTLLTKTKELQKIEDVYKRQGTEWSDQKNL